jgi:serine/threonine-protein kinase
MSPEQARGEVDKIDVRSDLYSAMVLFHELMTGGHYLKSKDTMEALLAGVITEEFGVLKLIGMVEGPMPPAEYMHLAAKGLNKDPAKRFQSADELVGAVHDILEGRMRVQCHVTATKRSFRELGRLVDRKPAVGVMVLLGIVAAILFSGVQLVRIAMS